MLGAGGFGLVKEGIAVGRLQTRKPKLVPRHCTHDRKQSLSGPYLWADEACRAWYKSSFSQRSCVCFPTGLRSNRTNQITTHAAPIDPSCPDTIVSNLF